MVIGDHVTEYDVEVLNLSGDGKTCSKPANAPLRYGSTGVYFDGYPTICGGFGSVYDCFKYNVQVTFVTLSQCITAVS